MSTQFSSQAVGSRAIDARRTLSLALPQHWPQYLTEALCLGIFMLVACLMATLLGHPDSPVLIQDPMVRRLLMGAAMGATAASIIYSPAGRFSGAHINPAVTLTFLRLRKIKAGDAVGYVLSQIVGGVLGVMTAALILGEAVADPSVQYAATVPGETGAIVAFAAELFISLVLMSTVLSVSNSWRWMRYTGCIVAVLVASFIAFEAPFSGMSMNPARSMASAIPSGIWTSFWIYLTAPPLGMLLAASLFMRRNGAHAVLCAKLHHDPRYRCIFRCGFARGSN